VRPPEDESNAAHGENCNGQPAGADAEDGFNLHKLKAQWFKSYAYPISDEVGGLCMRVMVQGMAHAAVGGLA
jgi:hypothetical protein